MGHGWPRRHPIFYSSNIGSASLEIGGFGFPIEFNSIFTTRTAEETQAKCSLTDPNIGLAGGYLRVTPLSGAGASLVVTPLGNATFEGWRFLPENTSTVLGYQSQTFEGFILGKCIRLGMLRENGMLPSLGTRLPRGFLHQGIQ